MKTRARPTELSSPPSAPVPWCVEKRSTAQRYSVVAKTAFAAAAQLGLQLHQCRVWRTDTYIQENEK